VLGARYRVERRLGQGGMGAVYLVRHLRTEERLALKLLHASVAADMSALERFRREATAPAKVDSDHVARVVDADVAPELGGAPFLVMEFLRGSDLGQVLASRGRLTPREVVDYLGQAARALDKAHSLGIIHRDLKPENLFLAERDDGTASIKIVDFGIAKVGATSAQTATGQMLGTPLYMAPEQLSGHHALVGPRTDVWAIGVIAFRLLAGRHYWVADSLPQLALMVTTQPMPRPSTLDPALGPAFDAWFSRCCARPVEQRFASVGEAVAALAGALGAGASAAPSVAYAATALAPAVGLAAAPPPTGVAAAAAGTPSFVTAGTPAPVASTAAPRPATAPAKSDGTRNAVLVVAGVLLLGFVALVIALVVFATPFASRSAGDSPAVVGPPSKDVPTSKDACATACVKLAQCTGITDPQCESSCKHLPAFAACAAREGCQAISSCAIGATCGGKEPQGTMSCRATADCEGTCLMRGGDPSTCDCACMHLMAPDRATEIVANNDCALVRCSQSCRPPAVSTAACVRCFSASCMAESMACKAR
jgi:serine/threonine-protein kinase